MREVKYKAGRLYYKSDRVDILENTKSYNIPSTTLFIVEGKFKDIWDLQNYIIQNIHGIHEEVIRNHDPYLLETIDKYKMDIEIWKQISIKELL